MRCRKRDERWRRGNLRARALLLTASTVLLTIAAAGALHIQLGGTHNYFGRPMEKPAICAAARML